ncbi:DUF2505 domain-containing protein [Nevskia ramosa]|uniref:DUF2505 domain-containing protein n=1 Tax=Nevskia ramosa TaxID=64002 RepID=UPI0003B5BF83|nr:DUF2505 domain-containing protein [Nevskia ramosa]
MEFSNEQVMPAPLERVEKMYWDLAFVPRKYRELGLQDIEVVSQKKEGRELQICCNFKMKPSIELPKIAQKFVRGGEALAVTQTDTWDMQTRTGRLDIVIHAFKTVTIRCDMKLEAHPQGAVNRMRWKIESSMPLIGGTIAKILAQDIQSKFKDDAAAANRVLKDY